MSRPRVFVTQPVAESALTRLCAVADVEVNADSSRIIGKAALCEGVARSDILFSLLARRRRQGRARRQSEAARRHLDGDHAGSYRHGGSDAAPAFRSPTFRRSSPMRPPTSRSVSCSRWRGGIVEGDKLFRQGVYPGSQSNHLAGAAVTGKTLGLIGGGRIGQAVARRAQGFGMRVLYADPHRLPPEREQAIGMTHARFDDVMREADFVSLHPQLTPQTRHLIGARELGLMKPTAFVINTSRGPVIDEAALTRALVEGRIAGAGLDVYEHEPKVTPALVEHGERRADAASRQRGVRIARGHGACRGRQRDRDDRGPPPTQLPQPRSVFGLTVVWQNCIRPGCPAIRRRDYGGASRPRESAQCGRRAERRREDLDVRGAATLHVRAGKHRDVPEDVRAGRPRAADPPSGTADRLLRQRNRPAQPDHHLWAYDSLDERVERRRGLFQDPAGSATSTSAARC